MSYEIYLVAVRPGEEPGDAVDRALDAEGDESTSMAGAAEELLRGELGDDVPVEVDGGAQHVVVTVAYLRSGAVDGLFRDVFSALACARAHTGWTAYDRQLGRALDLRADLAAVVEFFRDTIAVRDEFA